MSPARGGRRLLPRGRESRRIPVEIRFALGRTAIMADSFGSRANIMVDGQPFSLYRLDAVSRAHPAAARLQYALKILLENLLRTEDGRVVKSDDIAALANWKPTAVPDREIAFTPARVLLQDFT